VDWIKLALWHWNIVMKLQCSYKVRYFLTSRVTIVFKDPAQQIQSAKCVLFCGKFRNHKCLERNCSENYLDLRRMK
jgi:hypothetical protein